MANASLSAFSFSGFFFISAMRTEEYLARVFWLGEDGGAPFKIQNPNENKKVFVFILRETRTSARWRRRRRIRAWAVVNMAGAVANGGGHGYGIVEVCI